MPHLLAHRLPALRPRPDAVVGDVELGERRHLAQLVGQRLEDVVVHVEHGERLHLVDVLRQLEQVVAEEQQHADAVQVGHVLGHVVDVVARQVELEQRRQHVDAVVREAEQLVAGERQLGELVQQAEVLRHRLDLVVRHVDVLDALQRRQTNGELRQLVVLQLEPLQVDVARHVGQLRQLVVVQDEHAQLLEAREALRARGDGVVRHVEEGEQAQQAHGRRDLVEAEVGERELRHPARVRVVADVDEHGAARVVERRVERVGGQVERRHRLRYVERRELVAGDVEGEESVQPLHALREHAQLVVGEQQRLETAQFAHVARHAVQLVVRCVDQP